MFVTQWAHEGLHGRRPRWKNGGMRRRLASLLAAVALATLVVATPAAEASGTPPACPANVYVAGSGYWRLCSRYTTVGPLGSIGLVGDSVLLGSADLASNPSLPKMLSDAGWGPIELNSSLGMVVRNNSDQYASAVAMVKRWSDNGFHPDVIAVNLGANHMGTWPNANCTPTDTTYCANQINDLLATIATYHPDARVWWGKINYEPFGKGNGYGLGMLGWNKALDDAAATHPNLVLWDWPNALLYANPAILMDAARIHPSSGVQYVKRSTLMRDHITATMPWAKYVGPQATVPGAAGDAPSGYQRVDPSVAYDSAGEADPVLPDDHTTVVDLSSLVPEGTTSADVILTTDSSAGVGWLTVYPCSETKPVVSSLNYAADTPRSAQALVRLGADRTFCVYNAKATAVRVYLSGYFHPNEPLLFTPIPPVRPLDTRLSAKAAHLEVPVPVADSVAVTVTVTGTSAGGVIQIAHCDGSGVALPALSFQPSEVVAGAAFAAEWAAGTVCLDVVANGGGELPHVILDVTGTFTDDGDLQFVPAQAKRLLDTRPAYATGGWVGMQGMAQVIGLPVAPTGAQAVTGSITLVRPTSRAWLTAYSCAESLPPTSSVNAAAGLVMANSITVGIDPTQRTLCIRASHRTDTLFDVVGWWVTPLPEP